MTCIGPGPHHRGKESKGTCGSHGAQLARTGRMWPIRPQPRIKGRVCMECGGEHHAKGYCVRCYRINCRAKTAPAVAPPPATAPKPKSASNLPEGWFKPSPKIEHRSRPRMEEQINVVILGHTLPTPEQNHLARRHLERNAPDLLEMLGLAS